MKIAFLNGDVPTLYDGYHKLTNEILSALAEQFNVHLINFKGEKLDESNLPWNVSSYRTMVNEEEVYLKKRFHQICSLFSKESMVPWQFKALDIEQLNEQLKRISPDIIIVNQLRSAWVLKQLSKDLDASFIYIAHNCESLSYQSIAQLQTNNLLKKISENEARKVFELEKEILQRVDFCVALTAEDVDRLKQIDETPEYVVIPPGTKIPEIKLNRNEELSLLLVGSYKWDPKKRNALWLANEVFPLVKQSHPNIKLKIVGGGANDLADDVKDKQSVEIHSDVPSTAPYFSGNSIFVIPERQEGGFKLKTLEAASYGLPIVSTPAGIEGSNLIHGENCLVAHTREGFAEQIGRLIINYQLREQLGAHAKKEAVEHFQWEYVNNLYVQLMNRAAKVHA